MLQKWKRLSSRPIFKSKWLSLFSRSYQLPDGKIVKDYYHVSRPNYVSVIAVNKKGAILLERQYRRGVDEVLYELPAGWVEKNENVLSAAKRELCEETGYTGRAEKIITLYTNPGFSEMKASVVMIRVTGRKQSRPGKDEAIKVGFYPIQKVTAMLKRNRLKDMVSVAAVGYFLLFVQEKQSS